MTVWGRLELISSEGEGVRNRWTRRVLDDLTNGELVADPKNLVSLKSFEPPLFPDSLIMGEKKKKNWFILIILFVARIKVHFFL